MGWGFRSWPRTAGRSTRPAQAAVPALRICNFCIRERRVLGLRSRIAAAPLIVMVALFTLIPGLSSSVSVLVPVGALIAIGVARVLYKKGMLDKKPAGKEG